MSQTKVEDAKALAFKLTEQFEADGTDPHLALVAMSIIVSVLAAGVIKASPKFDIPGFVEKRRSEFLDLIGRTIDHSLAEQDLDMEEPSETLNKFDRHVHGTAENLPPV